MKKSFWERFAFIYDTAMKNSDKADKKAAEYIMTFLSEDCYILEAACGTGRFSCEIAPKIKQMHCCDYARNMLAETRKKAQAKDIYNIDYSVQDITSLDFADNSFDAVMAANVLHLLSEPEKAVSELKRVVKPEGLLILPNFVNAEVVSKWFLRLIKLFGFRAKNEWNRDDFFDFLNSNGLEVEEYRMFDSKQPLCVAITKIRR